MSTKISRIKYVASKWIVPCLLGIAGFAGGWVLAAPDTLPDEQRARNKPPSLVEYTQPGPLPTTPKPTRTDWTAERLRDWIEKSLSEGITISEAIWAASPEDQETLRREVWRLLLADGKWREALDACWNAPDLDDFNAGFQMVSKLAGERPAEVADHMAEQIRAGTLPFNAISCLTSSWIDTDAHAAAKFLRELKGEEPWVANLRLGMVGALLAKHPGEVSDADLSACFDKLVEPAQLISQFGQALGHGDPLRGMAWVQQLASPVQKRAAIEAVLSGASGRSAEFWPALALVTDNRLRDDAVRMWGGNRAHENSSTGLDAVTQIADPALRTTALKGYFSTAAGKDGRSAAASAMELYSSGKAGIEVLEAVFQACPEQAQVILSSGDQPDAIIRAAKLALAETP